MYDRAFKPFILRQECADDMSLDLIDMCVAQKFSLVQQVYSFIFFDNAHIFIVE